MVCGIFPISRAAGSERAIRSEVGSSQSAPLVATILFLRSQFPSQPTRLKENSRSRLFDILLRDEAIPTQSPDLDGDPQRRAGQMKKSDHHAEGTSLRRQPSSGMGERR